MAGEEDSSQAHTDTPPVPAEAEIAVCLGVLGWLSEFPAESKHLPELGQAVARAYKRVRKQRRIDAANARQQSLAKRLRPAAPQASRPCYICRASYLAMDAAYPLLCPSCAEQNREHRNHRADLSGRTAIVTGARIKVGYQVALKLLRDGAEVIATTRFPVDAVCRYACEPDYPAWRHRLKLHALDLRNLPAVHAFCDQVCKTLDGLDILINNAAQTIRRPADFYRALRARESHAFDALAPVDRLLLVDDSAGVETSNTGIQALGTVLGTKVPIPSSWMLPMEEVQSVELAEVMVINTMAPFILCSRLEPLMRRSRFRDRYIVNVTSAEGQFAHGDKMPHHPHTNMAKAALNMLTRTAAERCAGQGIYMNSVDPGWITHMVALDPAGPEESDPAVSGFVPPLDSVDGAARIYDPILRGIEGKPVSGLLLKNYEPVAW